MYLGAASDHIAICELADDILRMIACATYSDAEIAKIRLAFCKALNAHSAAEQASLNAVAPAIRLRHADLIRLHDEGLQKMRQDWIEFNRVWPLARLLQDPPRFATEFRKLVAELRRRFQWEDLQFYPRLASAETLARQRVGAGAAPERAIAAQAAG